MLSTIDYKIRLFLVILLITFLFQAAVYVLQRRELNWSGEVFSSNYATTWYDSQNKIQGERISNVLGGFIRGTDEMIALKMAKVSQNGDSWEDDNRVNVKIKRYKDIEKSSLNIFFIESRCGTLKTSKTLGLNSTFNLTPRQCCSVESAANLNPTRNVYILHTCPLGTDFHLHLPTYTQNMLSLTNVYVIPLSMAEALDGTPVTSLYRSGKLETSLYPIVHASDILRLAVLWRFGGTYCDMDILLIRSLSQLKSNFCGIESHKAVGNSILNFEPTGHGHDILTRILVQVNTGFNGQAWAANGPELITNTMLHECKATMETLTQCTVFTVYKQTVLYPLLWKNHMDIFNASTGANIVRTLKDTGFTVHLWNKFTAMYSVQVGSSQAYGLLADEFCPAVYWNCGDKF